MTSDLSETLIKTLFELTDKWVEAAFHEVIHEKEPPTEVHRLDIMWRSVANMLWGDNIEQKGAFIVEQAEQRKAGFTGYLPKNAIKNRLQTLISLGVPNTFLIIAVRESISELINMSFPEMKAEWERMADEVLPTSLQFFARADISVNSNQNGGIVYNQLKG